MTQQTTIPTKVSGDLLTAAEFNELNDTINNNADFVTGELVTLGDGITDLNLNSRLTAIEDTDTSNIQTYHTVDLPTGLTNGTIAFDSSAEVPVYTNNDLWYRSSDGASIDTFTEVDMFIVMGQSNADGKAEFINLNSQTSRSLEGLDRTGTQIHLSSIDHTTREYVEGTWEQYNPGTNAGTSSDRFGPELGFSDSIKAIVDGGGNDEYDKPVAILKFVKGSTSLATNWDSPDGDCYTAMIQDIPNGKFDLGQANYKFNIRGMIWFHGESDGSNQADAEAYEANLNTLFADIRSRFNKPNLPIIICQPWWDSLDANYPAYLETVRSAQQAVAGVSGVTKIGIIDTTSYEHRDEVHLNAKGMYELGEEIAAQMASLL